ncbi:MAG: tail fiber domain-containing protein [Flavobacteriaceae bacterium]
MKNYYFALLLIIIFFNISIAQVGIGNTNPKATLDITASNVATPSNTDGILIPRVNAFPVTNPTANQDGMLVFLTTTKIFYFWNWNTVTSTGVWTSIKGLGAEKIDGLSDGRSDNDGSQNGSSIYFGIDAGVFDDLSDNKNVGIGFQTLKANTTGIGNSAIGYKVMSSNTSGSSNIALGLLSLSNNTTGFGNISIGHNTLFSNTLGDDNLSFGYKSLYNNTSGGGNIAFGYETLLTNKAGNHTIAIGNYAMQLINDSSINFTNYSIAIGYEALRGKSITELNYGENNIALGYQSLYSNTSGDENVSLGFRSLWKNTIGGSNVSFGNNTLTANVSGNSNTAIGNKALKFNTSGNSNIAIGFESGYTNDAGNGNIFLGSQSGYNELGSDKLYIENSNANSTNALIYGEFDTDLLRINGELQIGNQSTTGFKFPSQRGTNSQVLKTNASGVLSWGDELNEIDHDFYKVGTTLPPTTINDNIFTFGNIGVGKNTASTSLDVLDTRGTTSLNILIEDMTGPPIPTASYGIKTTINNINNTLSTSDSFGIENNITVLIGGYGVKNNITGHIATSPTIYGVYNLINSISGIGYGSYNKITGNGYGVYSESLTGFSGYFLGEVAIGTTTANTYSLPSSRGTSNQIMQTDASGSVTWTAFPSESEDWKLTGNSGTNASTSFIGTTDNVALSFRTNSIEKMQLKTNGTLQLITDVDNQAQLKNANTFNNTSDANINFAVNESKDSWMVSSREGTSDNSGIYGNRDFITIWSPGDSNRIIRFLDEDSWTDNDGDPYNNTAEKSYIDSNGQYVQASDKNRKENINKITNASEKVTQLNGYTYAYKLNSSEKQKGQQAIKTSGVIAQELYEILPEAVQVNDKGEYFVHYAGIIPLLIEAIKEQQKEIKVLKQLEKRIIQLEKNSD